MKRFWRGRNDRCLTDCGAEAHGRCRLRPDAAACGPPGRPRGGRAVLDAPGRSWGRLGPVSPRTTIISSGAPRAWVTLKATGTPPRGRPTTTTRSPRRCPKSRCQAPSGIGTIPKCGNCRSRQRPSQPLGEGADHPLGEDVIRLVARPSDGSRRPLAERFQAKGEWRLNVMADAQTLQVQTETRAPCPRSGQPGSAAGQLAAADGSRTGAVRPGQAETPDWARAPGGS